MNGHVIRISITAFLLVVLGIGAYVVADRGDKQLAESDIPMQQTIERRADGFHPADVTVRKGGTVIFVNTTEKHFWPASNLHPSHAVYAAFDPEKPIAPEASWSFQFNEAGVWEFHDHLASSFGGTITVIGDSEFIRRECDNIRDAGRCWREELFATLASDGINRVYDLVANLYVADDYFRELCHTISHDVGLKAYGHYLTDKDSVLTPKASACAYGFYHGFMEGLLTMSGDIAQAREFCMYVDERITPYAPDTTLQCFHGIGHGAVDLALSTQGFAGNEALLTRSSLELCEAASMSDEELYRCTSGVYNSIANTYIEESYLSVDRDDPLKLCRAQPEEYKESCYGNLNSVLFWLADNSLAGSVGYVEEMEDEAHQQATMRYLSNLSASFSLLGSDVGDAQYRESVVVCRGLSKELHQPCVEGLVHGLLEHGTPGKEYVDAIGFCTSNVLTAGEQDICFTYAISNLQGWYSQSTSREICAGLSSEYRQYCEHI